MHQESAKRICRNKKDTKKSTKNWWNYETEKLVTEKKEILQEIVEYKTRKRLAGVQS